MILGDVERDGQDMLRMSPIRFVERMMDESRLITNTSIENCDNNCLHENKITSSVNSTEYPKIFKRCERRESTVYIYC
jgi:hypothetical protein